MIFGSIAFSFSSNFQVSRFSLSNGNDATAQVQTTGSDVSSGTTSDEKKSNLVKLEGILR